LVVDGSDLAIDGGDDSDVVVSESDIDLTDGRFTSVENITLADIYVTDEESGEEVLSDTQPKSATGDSLANTIVGNLADNSLDGGTGADTLLGGDGNDTLVVDAEDTLLDGGDGTDTIASSVSVLLVDSRFANIENIVLHGSDALTATGDDADNIITGNSGGNTLIGAAGADYLDGGLGSTNSLVGGDGIDTLIGAAGNDTLLIDSLDSLVDGADGSDWIVADFSASLSGGIYNVENILLTGSDNLTATGDEAANLIIGNSGANTITGGGGLDTLTGGEGADVFVIGDATDNAYGVDKDNTFALITDFTVGTDNLQLKGSLANYTVDSADSTQVLITSTDTSVGLVAKINVASGNAADILNDASFLA
jgi:Ca2+-binding RTX toxin-like protein